MIIEADNTCQTHDEQIRYHSRKKKTDVESLSFNQTEIDCIV